MMNSKPSFTSKTVFTGIVVLSLGACAPEQSADMQAAGDAVETQMQYPRLAWPVEPAYAAPGVANQWL